LFGRGIPLGIVKKGDKKGSGKKKTQWGWGGEGSRKESVEDTAGKIENVFVRLNVLGKDVEHLRTKSVEQWEFKET